VVAVSAFSLNGFSSRLGGRAPRRVSAFQGRSTGRVFYPEVSRKSRAEIARRAILPLDPISGRYGC
jgi:hypothetical protein